LVPVNVEKIASAPHLYLISAAVWNDVVRVVQTKSDHLKQSTVSDQAITP
jgi:hypothetical protein